MAGLIPQGFIENLRERTDLAELIGKRITLKKAGSNYKACCPFHDERTPSFNVRPDKGFYHCFGCGAHGDAIAFLQEYENLSFTEAVESLAAHLGLDVPYDESTKASMRKTQSLTGALEQAKEFYRQCLQQHPSGSLARDYLKQRGVDAETAERFAIGYAPPEGDALVRHVNKETLEALISVKAVTDRYERPRDLFRNRLMFPIRNSRGRTVAFGGRTLGDDKAKYINSPESEVYHKSREIYGLYEAKKATRRLERLVVVEGYMDVIALAQNGISYAVAASGTATNQESLQALLKPTQHLIFCFDGDEAGYRAADRALENLLELLQDGMHIQFLMLPEGDDPDSLIRREGGEAFQQRIDEATPLSRLLFERQTADLDLTLAEHRGELRSRVEPMLRRMPHSAMRDALWQELQRLTGRTRWQRQGDPKQGAGQPRAPEPTGQHPRIQLDRDTALSLALYEFPELAAEATETLEGLNEFPSSQAFAHWIQAIGAASRDDVLRGMATHTEARERFAGLFNRIEHFPERDKLHEDARRMLRRCQERKLSRAANEMLANRKPSELSDEEKRQLQDFFSRKNATKDSRTH